LQAALAGEAMVKRVRNNCDALKAPAAVAARKGA